MTIELKQKDAVKTLIRGSKIHGEGDNIGVGSLVPGAILLIAAVVTLLYFATTTDGVRVTQPVPQDSFPTTGP